MTPLVVAVVLSATVAATCLRWLLRGSGRRHKCKFSIVFHAEKHWLRDWFVADLTENHVNYIPHLNHLH